jgi:hypothetical protein
MVSFRQRTVYHEAGHTAAALAYGIPIISVTSIRIPRTCTGAGLECMVTLCLAGPAAEAYFCGSIEDGADRIDIDMARRYLARRCDQLRIGAEIARLCDAAEHLVQTTWAQQRIRLVAEALLARGTLTGADIDALPGPAPKATWSPPR